MQGEIAGHGPQEVEEVRTKLTQEDVSPGLRSSVNAYLMARARAEVIGERVEAVYKEVLEIHPLYADLEAERKGNGEPKRIFESKMMYLSTDEETVKEVYAEANATLLDRGIKPPNMPEDHCPACVAEVLQTKAEHLIIENAAEMLKVGIDAEQFRHKLLCLGLDEYRRFINLCVGLVVNLPDYKNPITGEVI